uniref:Uncharacterized protein n=1 Tax=Trypanosoma congolense (strain IL3000) TaxID=1068625 RepID=G0V010_TRYCI|nr:hypothetical protein, unlikely [Trypanosoma congolense IL3000]
MARENKRKTCANLRQVEDTQNYFVIFSIAQIVFCFPVSLFSFFETAQRKGQTALDLSLFKKNHSHTRTYACVRSQSSAVGSRQSSTYHPVLATAADPVA